MNTLFFYIILLLSKTPLPLLYLLSDFLFYIIYHLFQYRRKVVRQNLVNSFPEKSLQEIKSIEKKFYHNFTDHFIETLKAFTISQKELQQRLNFTNFQVFNEIKSENKNAIMMLGHVFNWEWLIGIAPLIPFENKFAVFKPIKSTFWNREISKLRERFSAQVISAHDIILKMMRMENNGNSIFLFVADQSPKTAKIQYKLSFLHQQTPIFIGFDKVIRKKNLGVIYCEITKPKRGYYQVNFKKIDPENTSFKEFEIAHSFFKELENTIYKNPDNWLWSHKRWKI